jgi:hypothetical protein
MWPTHPRPSPPRVVVAKELTPINLGSDSYGNINVICLLAANRLTIGDAIYSVSQVEYAARRDSYLDCFDL